MTLTIKTDASARSTSSSRISFIESLLGAIIKLFTSLPESTTPDRQRVKRVSFIPMEIRRGRRREKRKKDTKEEE